MEHGSRYAAGVLNLTSGSHVVHKASHMVRRENPGVCGHDDHVIHEHGEDEHDTMRATFTSQHYPDMRGMYNEHKRARRAYNPLKNTCEMALVSDHRFFASSLGQSSSSTTAAKMVSFLEEVNRIYKVCVFVCVYKCVENVYVNPEIL